MHTHLCASYVFWGERQRSKKVGGDLLLAHSVNGKNSSKEGGIGEAGCLVTSHKEFGGSQMNGMSKRVGEIMESFFITPF